MALFLVLLEQETTTQLSAVLLELRLEAQQSLLVLLEQQQ
jgi:hypothetical protein